MAMPSRATVVETVYHQLQNENASVFESKYSYAVASDEQPYARRLTITEDWQPLDLGWLLDQGCSQVAMRNQEGLFLQANPTEEEEQEIAARVIELCVCDNRTRTMHDPPRKSHLEIYPRESMRVRFTMPESVLIRCRKGEAKCDLFIVPR